MSSNNPFYPFHYKIIDYAGLFPPAELTFDEAIKNYAKYRLDKDNWMLSRFVIPQKKLNELITYKSLFIENPPFPFTVTGGVTDSTNAFKKDLESLLSNISEVTSIIGKDLISVESLELKVPILQDILFILNIISDTVSKFDTQPLEIYLEFFLSQKHNDDLKLILRHIKEFNFNNRNTKIKFIGYKVRTGGVVADAFPSIDKLASIIYECINNYGVQLKATAGLHHPIRRYEKSVQTHMYGFLNVVGACILTSVHKLDFNTIYEILQDEEPSNFRFTDQKFYWRNFEVSKEQIEFSRTKSFISFGSCSFDEPREDLESLGLLKR